MPQSAGWQGLPGLALFKGKLEDRFTAYFSELLLSPTILASFLCDICDLVTAEDACADAYVTTWMVVKDGFPDLAITLPNDLLIIEVKVDSPLNDWQIHTYARHLLEVKRDTPGSNGHLFILTPRYSSARSLREACAQATKAGLDAEVKAITWEQVGDWCAKIAPVLSGDDPRLTVYLHDFATLIR